MTQGWSDKARAESLRVRRLNALLHRGMMLSKRRRKALSFRSLGWAKLEKVGAKKLTFTHPPKQPSPESYKKFYDELVAAVPNPYGKKIQYKKLPIPKNYVDMDDVEFARASRAHHGYLDSLKKRYSLHVQKTATVADRVKQTRWVREELEWAWVGWADSIRKADADNKELSDGHWDKSLRIFETTKRMADSWDDSQLSLEMTALIGRLNLMRLSRLKRAREPQTLAVKWPKRGGLPQRQRMFLESVAFAEMDTTFLGEANARTYDLQGTRRTLDEMQALGYVTFAGNTARITQAGKMALWGSVKPKTVSPRFTMSSTFKQRLGKCYELSGQYVLEHPDTQLVHGTIQGLGNPPLKHAWVILPDGWRYEPVSDMALPEDAFNRYFNAKAKVTYSRDDMRRTVAQSGNWGPWEEKQALAAKWPKGKTMRVQEAAAEAVRQGVHPLWQEKIRDMMQYLTTTSGQPYGDREFSDVVSVKVNSKLVAGMRLWPLDGKIIVQREDGQKFALWQNKKTKKLVITPIKQKAKMPLAAKWPKRPVPNPFDELPSEVQTTIQGHLDKHQITREAAKENMERYLAKADSYGIDLEKEKRWYNDAHDEIAGLAAQHNLTLEQVAGMVAVMSPGQRWQHNMELVVHILEALESDETVTIDQSTSEWLKTKKGLDVAPGTYALKDAPAAAVAYRYDTLGGKYGYGSTMKAVELARGGDTDVLVSGPKVRSFFSNLVDPDGSLAVTVDIWMLRGMAMIGSKTDGKLRSILESPQNKKFDYFGGSYPWFAGLVTEMAELYGVFPPSRMQAMVWSVARAMAETEQKATRVYKQEWGRGAREEAD